MFSKSFVKVLVVFTGLSLALGAGSIISPSVASVGWALGTAIAIAAGIAYGRSGGAKLASWAGGSILGGLTIAIGCLLTFGFGGMPFSGVLAATTVGAVSGGLAALASSVAFGSPRMA
jgi:hypothetical protein